MLVAPSVLAADYLNLNNELNRVKAADFIHLDIMDGHFVPNLSFGPDLVAALRPATNIPFDVHLMVTDPMDYIKRFAEAGADILCFHAESDCDPAAVIEKIKASRIKPAMTVKPGTPADVLYPYCSDLYMVLVMTVEPGFGGQSMMKEQLKKCLELKRRFPHLVIEVDGGVNRENAALCAAHGVDICVAGTSVFRSENPEEEIRYYQKITA